MKELRIAQDIIREYARRSKKNYFQGTDLKVLYKELGKLRVFLESNERRVYVPTCKECDGWHPAPGSKKGYCSKGKGFTGKKEFCSSYGPRTPEQKAIDEYIRRRLEEDANG